MKHGNLGEIYVIKYFASKGYEVYTPFQDNSEFDLIVGKDSKIFKVEVKTTSSKRKGSWKVQIKKVRSNRTTNKIIPFDKTKVDFLAVYLEPEDQVIVFDSKDITVTTELSINSK